jgi:hypothetical protein
VHELDGMGWDEMGGLESMNMNIFCNANFIHVIVMRSYA